MWVFFVSLFVFVFVFPKYIKIKKLARVSRGMMRNEGVKGALKEDQAMAEKLNEIFASTLIART